MQKGQNVEVIAAKAQFNRLNQRAIHHFCRTRSKALHDQAAAHGKTLHGVHECALFNVLRQRLHEVCMPRTQLFLCMRISQQELLIFCNARILSQQCAPLRRCRHPLRRKKRHEHKDIEEKQPQCPEQGEFHAFPL